MQISIIVYAENNADTLAQCLKSYFSSPNTQVEVLLIDADSRDATLDYARAFPVRVLSAKGQRLGALLNLATEAAQYPWVAFLHADCLMPQDWPHKLMQRVEEGIVGAGGAVEYQNGGALAQLLEAESAIELERGSELAQHLMPRNALYRRDAVLAAGGFDPAFQTPQGLHRDLAQRLQARGGMLRAVPGAVVKRLRPWRLGRYLGLELKRATDGVLRHKKRPRDLSLAAVDDNLDRFASIFSLLVLLLLPPVVLGSILGAYGIQLWGGYGLLVLALWLAHLPMTLRLMVQAGPAALFLYPAMAFLRDIARGIGMLKGLWRYYVRGLNA